MTTPTTTNPTLDDEITSTNSIYGDDTLLPLPSSSPPSQQPTETTCTLRLPSHPSIRLRLSFPSAYPDAPPSILGTETVGADAPKGAGRNAVQVAREVLGRTWRPGEPCLYDLLEEVADALGQQQDGAEPAAEGRDAADAGAPQSQQGGDAGGAHDVHGDGGPAHPEPRPPHTSDLPDPLGPPPPPPPWILSDTITEKKSVFLARAARVSSPLEAKRYIRHLLAHDKRAAKATHNVTAWRIHGSTAPVPQSVAVDVAYQDCDSDGETAAGSRVLHLLQLMDVWGVVVVVSRWYGGVLLGPDRFRIINGVAREAVVRCVGGGEGGGGLKGRGKR